MNYMKLVMDSRNLSVRQAKEYMFELFFTNDKERKHFKTL
ncbi:hypothetical protein B14911_10692 [Bacillus sp. NRRL B-14911]|nr:hypothetical protein B14911_10692 [Bacillus sp. NRRL B-14911]